MGLLARDSVDALDRAGKRSSTGLSTGEYGSVIGSGGSIRATRDCLRGRDLNEGVREGGALCTLGLESAVVGFGSFQCLEMEGHRRLSLAVRLSVEYSPDLRRLLDRPPTNSSSLNASSPGVHSSADGWTRAD